VKVEIGPYSENGEDRLVSVHIDRYDSWSADHTLALIILPVLKQLQATKQGSPFVKNEDVPEELHSDEADAWEVDEHFHARWNWVLNEMIWAFDQIVSEEIDNNFEDVAYHKRLSNGLLLFGKYYQNLWD
jgi:hypothetical protein